MADPRTLTMLPVFEGPLDGLTIPLRRRVDVFVWLDLEGRTRPEPGAGRFLYRRGRGGYVFAGHAARQCDCGAIVEPTATGDRARCLCGAT